MGEGGQGKVRRGGGGGGAAAFRPAIVKRRGPFYGLQHQGG